MAKMIGPDAVLNPRCVSRRNLLVQSSSAALLVGGGVPHIVVSLAADDTTIQPRALVDIHSHIFNAQDIPIESFIVDVVAQRHWAARTANWLGVLTLTRRVVVGKGKNYLEELAKLGTMLNEGRSVEGQTGAPNAAADLLQAEVENLILNRKDKDSGTEAADVDPKVREAESLRFLKAYFLPQAEPLESSSPGETSEETALDPQSPEGRAAALRYVTEAHLPDKGAKLFEAQKLRFLNSVPPSHLDGTVSTSESAAPALSDETPGFSPEIKKNRQRLEDDMVASVKGVGNSIAKSDEPGDSLLTWAAKFDRYRVEQAAELCTVFRGVPEGPRLYAPSMLDYQYWLGDQKETPTSLSDQAKLMSKISELRPNGKMLHGFYPYDPVRAVLESDEFYNQPKERRALELLKIAVREQGFLGAKLYPPMGFRAANNKQFKEIDDFGPRVGRLLKTLRGKMPVEDFGERLDRELLALYDWCLSEDVPILAHSSPSQYSFKKAADRPTPHAWEELMGTPQAPTKYATLRLNIGHFGGAWCLGKTKRTEEQLSGSECKVIGEDETASWLVQNTWAGKVVSMLAGAGTVLPNLYGDLADLSAVSNPDEREQWRVFYRHVGKLLTANPSAKTRIMYGTDWSMLGRETGHAHYFSKMLDAVNGLVPALGRDFVDDFFWRNSGRYLGLFRTKGETTPPQTRQRLERFHQKNRNSAEFLALLSTFDRLAEK